MRTRALILVDSPEIVGVRTKNGSRTDIEELKINERKHAQIFRKTLVIFELQLDIALLLRSNSIIHGLQLVANR